MSKKNGLKKYDQDLFHAAKLGNLRAAMEALKFGADPKATDHLGYGALMYAVRAGSVNVVELLAPLSDGGIVNTMGLTPLMSASRFNLRPMLASLLPISQINELSLDGMSALSFAIESRCEATALALLDAGADPRLGQKKGAPAMVAACGYGLDRVVKRLASDPRVDVDLRVPLGGATALMAGASQGSVECARALLGNKANVDLVDEHGRSALMCAADNAMVDAVAFLLERANPWLCDKMGSSALTLAVLGDASECGELITEALLRSGNDVSVLIEMSKAQGVSISRGNKYMSDFFGEHVKRVSERIGIAEASAERSKSVPKPRL